MGLCRRMLLFFCLSIALNAHAAMPEFSDSERQWLEQGHLLRYSEVNWKPLSDVDSIPLYRGMIADYLNLISKRSGLCLGFVRAGDSWQDVLDKYRQREIELIPALGKDDKIGRPFVYTDPFAVFPLVIATRSDIDFISATSELAGKKVGVGKGHTSHHFLNSHYPDIQLVTTQDVPSGLQLLEQGAIDAFVGHLAVVNYNINKSGYDLKIAGKTEFNFEHRIGIDPDYAPAVTIINKVLGTITENEHNRIYNKWVRLNPSPRNYALVFQLAGTAVLILAALGSITLFLFKNNRRLKIYQEKLTTAQKELRELNAGLEEQVFKRTAEVVAAHEKTRQLLLEKSESERRARELARRSDLILQSVTEGIFGIDRDGCTTFVNAAAERLLGYHAAELIGRRIHFVIHQSSNERNCSTCGALSEGAVRDIQDIYRRSDGTGFPVQVHSAPLIENNETIGVVVVFSDISERLAAEQQMIETQKFEAIGQLAAGVAHEINTPIQYLQNNVAFFRDTFKDLTAYLHDVQLFLNGDDPLDRQRIAEKIAALKAEYDLDYLLAEIPNSIDETLYGVDQIIKIVTAMKEFSHPGEGEKTAVDLNRIIESAATISKNEWKYVAELNLDLDPQLPTLLCDPNSWSRLVLNLIVNSAHAIEERQDDEERSGLIKVSTRGSEDRIELSIQDNGSGIDEDKKKLIFEPFFTTKKAGKGTGQGLAFAHNLIVNVHQGTITCNSRPGDGTVFEITVPRSL